MSELERIRQTYRGYGQVTRWRPTNRGNRLILEEQTRALRNILQEHLILPFPAQFSALDIGCGGGLNLARLANLGAVPQRLFGIDLINDRVIQARNAHPDMHFVEADGARLPFPSRAFDFIILSGVFSSIRDNSIIYNLASEVKRTLKPSGCILWYDIRYPSPNRNVHPVTRKHLQTYFPGFSIRLRSLTVIPPLVRRIPSLYNVLNCIPIFRCNWFGLLTRS